MAALRVSPGMGTHFPVRGQGWLLPLAIASAPDMRPGPPQRGLGWKYLGGSWDTTDVRAPGSTDLQKQAQGHVHECSLQHYLHSQRAGNNAGFSASSRLRKQAHSCRGDDCSRFLRIIFSPEVLG